MSRSEERRRRFVELQLSKLLNEADDSLIGCYLCNKGFQEYAVVRMRGGRRLRVRLTDDSFIGMACDVVTAVRGLS